MIDEYEGIQLYAKDFISPQMNADEHGLIGGISAKNAKGTKSRKSCDCHSKLPGMLHPQDATYLLSVFICVHLWTILNFSFFAPLHLRAEITQAEMG